MRFARREIAEACAGLLHVEALRAARDIDAWVRERGWPEAMITSVSRSLDWYSDVGLEVPSFSWHLVDCAFDLRIANYTTEQREELREWIEGRCCGPQWELVFRTHGTGPHFHVAYKDFVRRKKFNQQRGEG